MISREKIKALVDAFETRHMYPDGYAMDHIGEALVACLEDVAAPPQAEAKPHPECGTGCNCLAQCGDVYAHQADRNAEDARLLDWAVANSKDMGGYFEVRTGEGVGDLRERIITAREQAEAQSKEGGAK